jgi:uncharacterized protein YybS (DUF2232 family)
MRALANFIMQGRIQAAVIAFIGLPLISPAAVALVTMRRGALDGSLLLFWAILPVLITLNFSEINPLFAMLSIVSLLVVLGGAQLLRKTESWPATLIGIVAISAAASLILAQLLPGEVQNFVPVVEEFLQQAQASLPPEQRLIGIDQRMVLGSMAYLFALSAVTGILLGRWWQALLYNPGGFESEFHRLRLSPLLAGLCVVSAAMSADQSLIWSNLFALPLLITGLAVVHAVVALKKMGKVWLVMMYIGVVVLANLFVLWLVLLAVLDSWIDFRSRIKVNP